jgi:tRNA 2-thiocytidine biosynthesis protein TtcA
VVIRPLVYVAESDLARFARLREFPIIPCDLCGSQENLKRRQMSQMLLEWERRFPGRVQTIFSALARVDPSHLMDSNLFDFRGLAPTGKPDAAGDTAFDEVPCAPEVDSVVRFADDSEPDL